MYLDEEVFALAFPTIQRRPTLKWVSFYTFLYTYIKIHYSDEKYFYTKGLHALHCIAHCGCVF